MKAVTGSLWRAATARERVTLSRSLAVAARVICLPLCAAFGLTAAADDRAKEEAAAAEKLCADELPRWKLTADGAAIDDPKEPVLRWTNPAAGRVYGNTYVWLQGGRPVAVGCLFRNFHPYNMFVGELTALAGTKLIAKRADKV